MPRNNSAGSASVRLFVQIFLLFALIVPTNSGAISPFKRTWASRGIGGGGALFAPTLSPHDPALLYMSTDMSSIFRSENFGHRWKTLHFSSIQGGVGTEVRFTSDPEILYSINLKGEQRTPVKSTDGGSGWTVLAGDPTNNETYFLSADPDANDRVLISSWNNLYFSSDGGSTFSNIYTGASSGSGLNIAGVFWDNSSIYVGTSDGLVTSTDNGQSFNHYSTTGLPAGEVMVSFTGAREASTVRLVAITANSDDVWPGWGSGGMGDVLYSAGDVFQLPGGLTQWVPINNGIDGNDHPVFVSMARNDVDTIWAAGGDIDDYVPIVYKSTDGGANWNSVFLTTNNSNIKTGWSGHGGDSGWWFGEYALGFGVSPADPNRAVMTDLGFVHVTSDGGVSWNQAYVHPSDQNQAGTAITKGGRYRGIGLQQTSVWWLHWSEAKTLTAAFTDIRGMRSTDGGVRWIAGSASGLTQNSTYHIVQHPVSGKMYAATSTVHDIYQSTYLTDARLDGGDGQVMVSSDNGSSWQVLHDFNNPVVWLALDPINGEKLYASVVDSSVGDVWVTGNLSNGTSATWSKLAKPDIRTKGHPFNIHVLNDGTLVATYSGHRDTGGAFTQSSGVFVSTDGGNSWSDRSDSGMMRWTMDLVIDPHDSAQNTWYVGVYSHWGAPPNEVGGLYRTTDRGLNWTRISDLYRVGSCTIDPQDGNVLYLSTEMQGLWVTENLKADTVIFQQIAAYPFRQPTRIFFNPYDLKEIWVTSFGGGMRASFQPSLSHAISALQILSGDTGDGIDFNDDGLVNLKDAVMMIQLLAGL